MHPQDASEKARSHGELLGIRIHARDFSLTSWFGAELSISEWRRTSDDSQRSQLPRALLLALSQVTSALYGGKARHGGNLIKLFLPRAVFLLRQPHSFFSGYLLGGHDSSTAIKIGTRN
jgi:hypothetical protein